MPKIKPADKRYSFQVVEKKIEASWDKINAYEKTKRHRAKGEDYYFIDGPPYTSGSVHLGTAWNKILKDAVIRYRRMNNFNVRDQPGYDMHGLPIEVLVEKTLGIKNKKQIEDFGVEKFVLKCKEFSLEYVKKMTEQFKSLGVWMDWSNPYLTITNEYIESAWWTLKKAYDNGLLFQSERVLSWCPRCETALAEAEIEYWDEKDPSIYVKFKLKNKEKEYTSESPSANPRILIHPVHEYIVVWTTTPWTLPANMAVAVHPEFDYVKIKVDDEILILLEERVEDVLKLGNYKNYKILEKFKGKDIDGLEYIQPLCEEVPYHKPLSHKVILTDFVTTEHTGIVHIAPGHGPEDFEAGMQYNIEPFCPVTENGSFNASAGKYAKINVKEANQIIINDLERKKLLLYSGSVTHRYGHCWRCSTPIIYRVTKQWFLKVTAIKEKMLAEIKKIQWYPAWAGEARFADWVSTARDWCISRQRYWGIPIPIWVCKCGEIKVVTSGKELKIKDLHRPWIDYVKFKCPKCGNEMSRVNDVLDVWFDSAVCSWAQLNYPENEKEFKRWWPCRWITEAHDQTRGWFYSQLVAGIIAFDSTPYNSVLMHGWALDEKGVAMSKSLGNVIEPEEIIKKYGIDTLRFYLLSTSAPWEDLPFSYETIKNVNKMFNIFWNVYVFATTYMALDNFENLDLDKVQNYLRIEDRWILSRMESVKVNVAENIENYNLHKATRELQEFILEDLSRWYVRLIKDRAWLEEAPHDKKAVYKALYDCLVNVSLLLVPFTPFISEEIYQNLSGNMPTVCMEDWPKVNLHLIDKKLEFQMEIVREITESVSNARQKAGIKLRWPVKRVLIETDSDDVKDAVSTLSHILLDQTNAKNIEFGALTVGVASEFSGGKIYVDTEITEELKAEAFAREIIRRVQEMRKQANLDVEDHIETQIIANEKISNYLMSWLEFIKKETRSKSFEFKTALEGDLVKDWDIEGEKIKLSIRKIR